MGKNTHRVQCWKNKYKNNYKNSITDMFHVESVEERKSNIILEAEK